MAETQRAEGNVRFQLTVRPVRRMRIVMASSTPRILTGSVPGMGADAKKALAFVWAFQQTDPLMAPARSAVEDKVNVSADAEADVSR